MRFFFLCIKHPTRSSPTRSLLLRRKWSPNNQRQRRNGLLLPSRPFWKWPGRCLMTTRGPIRHLTAHSISRTGPYDEHYCVWLPCLHNAQYIPGIMHTFWVKLYFVVVWYEPFILILILDSSALGQSHDCPNVSEESLKIWADNSNSCTKNCDYSHNKTKYKVCLS